MAASPDQASGPHSASQARPTDHPTAVQERNDGEEFGEWLKEELRKKQEETSTGIDIPDGILSPTVGKAQELLGNVADDLAIAAVLIAVLAAFFFIRPGLRLLTVCLFEGQPFARLRAIRELFYCWRRLWKVESLYDAARLRVEIELLLPPPVDESVAQPTAETQKRERASYRQRRREWRRRLTEKLDELRKQGGSPKIEVDDWFSVMKAEDGIKRYFAVMHRDKSSPTFDNKRFHARVEFPPGFVAPLYLIHGLLAHVHENWNPVITGYSRLSRFGGVQVLGSAREVNLAAFQQYMLDCWLLWGPSIPLCSCSQWNRTVAVQMGYGDENNSLPLIDRSDHNQNTLIEHLRRQTFNPDGQEVVAIPATVIGRIADGRILDRAHVCPAQNNIGNQLIVEFERFRDIGQNSDQSPGYYSAYIWIMFSIRVGTGRPWSRRDGWRCVIPFFDHGNIADPRIYPFLKEDLARKTLATLRSLIDRHPTVRFDYACAFDDSNCGSSLLFPPAGSTLRQQMEHMLHDLGPFPGRERLCLEPNRDGTFSACHLPELVEEYYRKIEYVNAQYTIRFRDLECDDAPLLERFYKELYVSEFPDANERESLENISTYLRLKQTGWYGKNNYHVLLVLEGEAIVGGAVCDYLEAVNAGIIEFFVVASHHRARGLGARLHREVEILLNMDAVNARGRPLALLAAEMEDPFRVRPAAKGLDPFHRVLIWHRLGYRRLLFPYVQPALAAEKSAVRHLMLIAKPSTGASGTGVKSQTIKALLKGYLIWAMRIDRPESSPEYREMAEWLGATATIPLSPLDAYVGHDRARPLQVREIDGPGDTDFDAVCALYGRAFGHSGIAIKPEAFARALAEVSASNCRHDYHLWSLRADAGGTVAGMASFFSFEGWGFGGYIALEPPLRSGGRLPLLVARIEERMIRDDRGVRGWFIECAKPAQVAAFTRLGFRTIAVDYRQPPLSPDVAGDEPLRLLYKPLGWCPPDGTTAPTSEEFLEAMRRIFEVVYGLSAPTDHPLYDALSAQTRGWRDGRIVYRAS